MLALGSFGRTRKRLARGLVVAHRQAPAFSIIHTCHILPPFEIDLGLRLAVFAGSGGKYLFHRIG